MKKRGLSHIEAILSFVIFVGFLIFAFFFFSPFGEDNRVLDSSLAYALREVQLNTTIPLESYSVVINEDVIDPIIGITINTSIENALIRVENSSGSVLSSEKNGDLIFFTLPDNNFARVLFAADFPDYGPATGVLLDETNYSISSSDRIDAYSEQRFLALNASYHNDYITLKKDFNLPNRVDFSFTLTFDNGDKIIAERPIPAELEVVSQEERIEIIRDTTGNVEFADLIIKLW